MIHILLLYYLNVNYVNPVIQHQVVAIYTISCDSKRSRNLKRIIDIWRSFVAKKYLLKMLLEHSCTATNIETTRLGVTIKGELC